VLPPDAPLVSINDHLVEPPDVWAGRPDQPHIETIDGEERWIFGHESLTVRELSVLAPGGTRATSLAEMDPAVYDPSERLRAMDADGVAVHTVLPHVIGFAGERLRFLDGTGARVAAVRRYNDFVTNEFGAAAPDRLVAVALLPLVDLVDGPRELEHAVANGARAVSVPHDPTSIGAPPFGDPQWDRVFATAVEADVPVLIHVGSSGAPASVLGLTRAPGAALATGAFDVANALADLMYAYTFVRHPRLRVVLVEGGIGWLAHVVDRMAFFGRQRPELWAPPRRDRTPAEIVRQQVHVTFIDDADGIARLDDQLVARVHWQCDFPHADSPWPHSRAALAAQLREVDQDTARAIAGGNTARLLRL
jgi:predicted TIM-barrel fold metal-dependent hydrolase